MASQQATLGKASTSTGFPVQLHLGSGTSRSGINLPVQFVNPNISVPIRLPSSTNNINTMDSGSSGLPLHLANSNISFPLLSTSNASNLSTNSQKHMSTNLIPRVTPNLPLQLTNLHGSSNNIIQLQMVSPHNEKDDNMGENGKYKHIETCIMPVASNVIDQTSVTSMPTKAQESIGVTTYQLAGSHRHIIKNTGNAIQMNVPNNGMQIKNPPKSVYLIQKSAGFKPVASAETVATSTSQIPSPIIVRKPTTTAGIQFLPPGLTKSTISTKTTTVTKCAQLAPKISPQSFVVQKTTKIPQNIVPVSIGAKHSLPFVNSIKKINNPMKSQENQSLLLSAANISTVANPGNSKILLTQPKTSNNKIVLPVGMSNNLPTPMGSLYKLKINNGQSNNDGPTNLSALTPTVNDIPPLKPLSKNLTISKSGIITQDSNFLAENVFPHSTPGPRVEAIGDQEYSLSIPETNDSMNVSIPNSNVHSAENSFTISIPDKMKKLISKGSITDSMSAQDSEMNSSNAASVPAILRRSNADNNEKKNINARRRISQTSDKNDGICGNKMHSKFEDTPHEKSNLMLSVNETKTSLLICNDDLEISVDSDLQSNRLKSSMQNINLNKDRRKSRMSSDINHSNENNSEKNIESNNAYFKTIMNSNFKQRKENLGLDYILNDAPGLNWQNGVAYLSGSDLKFHLNEFGVIDIVDKKAENGTHGNGSFKQNSDFVREKKSMSPDDFYCCDECGCHGMAAEFVTPNFCSQSCRINYSKNVRVRKEKAISDMKKKKKPKRIVMQKRNAKEQNDPVEKSNVNPEPCISDLKINEDRLMIDEFDNNKSADEAKKNSWICPKSGFSWMKYLEYHKAVNVPDKFFKDISINKNGFRKGMKLEAIDPVHPSIFAVVTIANIHGHRLCLHFDTYNDEYDFWVNVDSCDIFPAGWCEKNKRPMKTPIGFDHQTFSWNLYLRQCKAIAAPKNLFLHLPDLHPCPNGFRVGMKLEAEDRKNSLTCVATVADVINNRILIHFDTWDDIYDYWVDPTSPYIHPIGWCDENGVSLTPPNSYKDPETFSWEDYLFKMGSSAVPARAFKPRPPHKLKAGMKLEAVDKRVPFLIRVATISDVRSHQIRISFDGWPDELSYWVDDDSPDIHPVGWCLKTGHPLEPPLSMALEESQEIGQCGTYGCRGLGNLSNPKLSIHFKTVDCPYKISSANPPLRDRLDESRPPAEHTEPRTKEPRKLEEITPKINKRKYEDDTKSEVISDDDLTVSKKKRDSFSITQDKVKYSVFEPGYKPNPNKIAPLFWGKNCQSLKEILQNESFRIDPRNWNNSEVLRFINKIAKCSDFSYVFFKHSIDGESFLMLSQEDLVNVLGMRLGPAIKIYNSILQLRQKIIS